MKRQSVASLENVEVPVLARDIDPTTFEVFMAFVEVGVPPDPEADFFEGAWDDDGVIADDTYLALCLVGPDGGIELDVAVYDVYVMVDASAERPVLYAGKISIF